jgi:hypothetical protein
MVIVPHTSPAQVSTHGAAGFPRVALWALLATFLVPGLFGHDLWPQDGIGFGRMWTMAHGGLADWLLPNIAGLPSLQGGPLPAWAGALLLQVLGPLAGEPVAAALANAAWYLAGLALLWHATRRFARRDEAQPLASAFGGEAGRMEFARLLADNAVLLAVATIGVLLRMHQNQGDAPAFLFSSLALFALSSIEWNGEVAAAVAGAACGALALALGPVPALAMLCACMSVFLLAHRAASSPPQRLARALVCLASALVIAISWPLLATQLLGEPARLWFGAWLHATPHAPARVADGAWFLRTAAWFTWPLWPLAAWAAYAWRESLRSAQLARPLLVLAGVLAGMLFEAPLDDHALVCLLPALAVLAAQATGTLRRGFENLVDWMAITMFSFVTFFFWAYWLAMQSGHPPAMAASVARLAPGFVPSFSPALLAIAMLITIAWAAVVRWRVVRRPKVLWRGPLLAAAGVVAVWTVANTLFLPAVDHRFSYRAFAGEIARASTGALAGRGTTSEACVLALGVPPSELGVLAYYGAAQGMRLRGAGNCALVLERSTRRREAMPDDVVWEGVRAASPGEHWVLRSR